MLLEFSGNVEAFCDAVRRQLTSLVTSGFRVLTGGLSVYVASLDSSNLPSEMSLKEAGPASSLVTVP